MRHALIPAGFLTLGLAAVASAVVEIDVGTPAATNHLGYGWSVSEDHGGRSFTWITKREADLWFELDDAAPLEVTVTAAPLYVLYQRQYVGVYVNNRFLVEWVCPDAPDFTEFSARVPASALKPGRNRLIFRTSYQKREGRDPRRLALAVDRVTLQRAKP